VSVREFLPEKEPESINVQARISKDLADRCRKIMLREDLTWSEAIEAALKSFVKELEKEKK
jgi:uncharacterized protein YjcR